MEENVKRCSIELKRHEISMIQTSMDYLEVPLDSKLLLLICRHELRGQSKGSEGCNTSACLRRIYSLSVIKTRSRGNADHV